MILKLSGADFSANNIGQITMPRILNPFTLAAIELSGNATMTDEQKDELDLFFESVGAFGNVSNLWSKLDKVYLPFICTALANSCVNYKSGTNDATPDSSWLELRDHGIARKAGSTKGTSLIVDSNYVWNWSNKSAFVLNTKPITTNSLGCGVTNYKSAYGTIFEQLNVIGQTIAAGFRCSTEAKCQNTNLVNSEGTGNAKFTEDTSAKFRGIGCNGSAVVYCLDGTAHTTTVNPNAAQYLNSNAKELKFSQYANGDIDENGVPLGGVILGSYLTQAETQALMDAANRLWDAFK